MVFNILKTLKKSVNKTARRSKTIYNQDSGKFRAVLKGLKGRKKGEKGNSRLPALDAMKSAFGLEVGGQKVRKNRKSRYLISTQRWESRQSLGGTSITFFGRKLTSAKWGFYLLNRDGKEFTLTKSEFYTVGCLLEEQVKIFLSDTNPPVFTLQTQSDEREVIQFFTKIAKKINSVIKYNLVQRNRRGLTVFEFSKKRR